MITNSKKILLGLAACTLMLSSCIDDDSISSSDQYNKEQTQIDEYIAANSLNAKIDTSNAQLRYVVNVEGTGEYPENDDVALVNIKGTTLDGSSFIVDDSTYIHIDAWTAGYYVLQPQFKVGSDVTMFIPSLYGYGANGGFDGKLPGNTPMRLDVKLMEAISPFDYDQRRIDKYIEDKGLTAEIDSTQGLRYIITKEGTGDYPTGSSTVTVKYKGTLLDGTEFDSSPSATFALSNLIRGWKVLMPYVSEGGSITMFLPYNFAYGRDGNNSIGPYTPLVFEIDLIAIQ
ncbi:FKBP-type peptidyl-prolyl cis-trans isomerase [Fulvivirga ligni]|uniref:FKBP-type peptidyl-prolyl cis-trans isomerase n=1 Tax=Fulvivirga ligni TaxID=2904246 RepID=UPI001F2B6DEE|nr:FKBP-type peptidyl-prolyl cis-trans isomerase [Fulvivirga ligni]UII23618.1 FKBP-type peptidyl-prolyl cis-trans isomerase [Fulvivirga ligni]